MNIFIKNMVCNRCVTAVQQIFNDVGLQPEKVSLGEVDLKEESISESVSQELDGKLQRLGFERIDDRKARLIEGIKNKIIQLIHHSEQVNRRYNWSKILADEMHYDYNYLSSLFSSVEGVTIEQYIIRQKIERAKELLFYDELNLSEIAIRLGYSSVAHLSSQFKKVTGMTPSELKKGRNSENARKSIDSVK
jgi:AraC-like DNA-binding protein